MEKPKYTKIKTVEELKKASAVDGGADFFILLNFGARSSKHIDYNKGADLFWVWNLIDDSEQELTAEQIVDKEFTNIGEAMEKGAFYQETYA